MSLFMFDRAGLFYLKEGVRFCSIKVLKGFGKCIATFKGAVSRNSAKLGSHKMPVKLRETKITA